MPSRVRDTSNAKYTAEPLADDDHEKRILIKKAVKVNKQK
jgi:hypothetical protein